MEGSLGTKRKRSGPVRRSDRNLSKVRVRRARAGDLDLLVDHRLRMFRSMRRGSTKQLDEVRPAYRGWIQRETRAHRLIAFVAVTSHGRPIASGAVWLQPAPPRPGRLKPLAVPYLMSMYTEPSRRHSGAATAIVRRAMHWAQSRGFSRLTLHASRFGRPLYRKLGFARGWEMRVDLPAKNRRQHRSR